MKIEQLFGTQTDIKEVLEMLKKDEEVYDVFLHFKPSMQERLLKFFSGQRGIEILYDRVFHKIMDPVEKPERLESFLSEFLGEIIKIVEVMPREGYDLSATGSLVVMDIIVKTEQGALINVEVQKIGYLFPGERANCYISDLIMRQYNQLRNKLGKNFTYGDMKPAYLIVLMDESPSGISKAFPNYIHERRVEYSSNIEVNDLEKIYFVSLDIFHSVVHNVDNKLDAWLTFLSSEEPERIVELVERYPEFVEYYKEIADFRKSPKELIGMFSEALRIMDENTMKYMMNQWKEESERLQVECERLQAERCRMQEENTKMQEENTKMQEELIALKKALADMQDRSN